LFAESFVTHDENTAQTQKGETPMKKYLVSSLMLGVLFLALTGMPLQSAYANDQRGWHRGGDDRGDCQNTKVPEPASFVLLSSGIAGIGLYNFIKRKNRK
jgi:PEP-CTERM motif